MAAAARDKVAQMEAKVQGSQSKIEQAQVAFGKAPDPLAGGHHAHTGGLGRRRERPALLEYAACDQATAIRTGPGTTVELHPVFSLGVLA